MRYSPLLVLAATFSFAGASQAKPAGLIDCPVQGLSAKERAATGTSLLDGSGAAASRAHDTVARPAAGCAKANGWTPAQTEAAITWGIWKLMDVEAERRSGLGDADLAILHAYVDQDPTRVDGMDHFSSAQVNRLIADLRQRGAHLHDAGKDTERELGFLMLLKEEKAQEAEFGGS